MPALAHMHPANLVLGSIAQGAEIAAYDRNPTFANLCRDAQTWSEESCEAFREIAADAATGEDIVREIAYDGQIPPAEASRLRRAFREIEHEALTGEIHA